MTVSKELLEDLRIISMFIQFSDADKSSIDDMSSSGTCVLSRYEKGKLTFNLLANSNNNHVETGILYIAIQEDESSFIQECQKINIIENGFDYLVATFNTEHCELSGTIKFLAERLALLDCHDEQYGRRKEPRIKIGKERSAIFGLSSAEQKIFSKSAKIIQPCAVISASIHGICVITPFENPAFKNTENFNIQLAFENPVQTVILQAHKVHSKLTDTQSKVFSTISCQLLEPIHYVWKERVIKMLEAGYGDSAN